jgi:hypothetical protein
VSTLGLEPELFLLTTGTFNLVVKDRRRYPPERGVFSPEEVCLVRSRVRSTRRAKRPAPQAGILLSSKPFKSYCPAALVSIHWDHRISTCFPHLKLDQSLRKWEFSRARQNASSDSPCRARAPGSTRASFGTSRVGRFLVKKRTFGGFCENAKPFEDRCPRIEASWPRPISGI